MTRINVLHPSRLTGKHLVAEYRELPRVFGLVRKAVARGETPGRYAGLGTYTMGTGHVKFFYSRLGWLWLRFKSLVSEMENRGYRPQFFAEGLADEYTDIPAGWWGDWEPRYRDKLINLARLIEKEPGYYESIIL